MEENRRAAIILGLALLLMFLVILGFGSWIYLNYSWDPFYLQPRNPEVRKASWNLWWVVPLGVVSATWLSGLLKEEPLYFVLGIVISWIFNTVGYLIVQACTHRPK